MRDLALEAVLLVESAQIDPDGTAVRLLRLVEEARRLPGEYQLIQVLRTTVGTLHSVDEAIERVEPLARELVGKLPTIVTLIFLAKILDAKGERVEADRTWHRALIASPPELMPEVDVERLRKLARVRLNIGRR